MTCKCCDLLSRPVDATEWFLAETKCGMHVPLFMVANELIRERVRIAGSITHSCHGESHKTGIFKALPNLDQPLP